MSPSIIDFSAQFGGSDAADAVLPHFRALKAAAQGVQLSGFPFPELTFILRVDGDIHLFGFSGPSYPDVDKAGEYLSIDIGITKNDRLDVSTRISEALLSSEQVVVTAILDAGKAGLDRDALRGSLKLLVDRYEESLH